jgi:hypothetical protein
MAGQAIDLVWRPEGSRHLIVGHRPSAHDFNSVASRQPPCSTSTLFARHGCPFLGGVGSPLPCSGKRWAMDIRKLYLERFPPRSWCFDGFSEEACSSATPVLTQEQDLALQLDAPTAAGCAKIYEEKASGAQRERREVDCLAGAVDCPVQGSATHHRPGDRFRRRATARGTAGDAGAAASQARAREAWDPAVERDVIDLDAGGRRAWVLGRVADRKPKVPAHRPENLTSGGKRSHGRLGRWS